MLNLIQATRTKKPIKRAIWTTYFYKVDKIALTEEDILAADWEFEGQIWIEILDFNQKYFLDNMGNLFSSRTQRLLIPKINTAGYYEVTLRAASGNAASYLIHHLIAKYFLGHISKDSNMVINHKDGKKLNNSLSNLEVVSRSRNSKHAFELGLNSSRKGVKSNLSKLISEDVITIRKLYLDGVSQDRLALQFNITQSNVSRIVNKKTWSHLC